ncbi:MAG: hypothetical protein WA997_02830 [Anaerolineales bacterium]
MALHAACLVAQAGQFQAGGEDDTVVLQGGIVVAGNTLDGCADGGSRFNATKLAAVCTHEGDVTGGAVAFGAAGGDLRGIVLIPVAEGLSLDIVVG